MRGQFGIRTGVQDFACGAGAMSDLDAVAAGASDQDLERAAGAAKDGLANLTIAFCSGLDECSHPVR